MRAASAVRRGPQSPPARSAEQGSPRAMAGAQRRLMLGAEGEGSEEVKDEERKGGREETNIYKEVNVLNVVSLSFTSYVFKVSRT